ncbi:hypothetical protein ROJ8625_00696 [Roseivivax jejudonensis]|uniref:Lipoprotein n=1 Tax=Roseivivax jejudonensis TaxID=1529041 RepID=A0A1X6YGE0_9RHOB|nr:hypothetical protein [Roseivivax jejudonensis]SLN19906.1 hypothetical protein ROJ8625_00696 [Roseivivax jejudonensis]
MRRILVGASMLALAACVQTIETTTPFDPNEVAFINQRGAADITGQAFLRQAGGGVVTCAGEQVQLIPAGTFAKERLSQLYGSVQGGRIGTMVGASQENVDPRYLEMVRTSQCDAEGDFEFRNVANGDYYVLSGVRWTVPGSYIPEGGSMAKLVQVRSGQDQRVLLN